MHMRLLHAAALAVAVFGGLSAIPASWFWLSWKYVEVRPDGSLVHDTHIRRDFLGSYSVIIRQDGVAVCEAKGGPFTYRRNSGAPQERDLAWWAPSDPRCAALPSGEYEMETCRFVHLPLLPAKPMCVRSEFTLE